MKKLFLIVGVTVFTTGLYAQVADTSQGKPGISVQKREDPKNGHISGKIVDNTTKAGISGASVQVFATERDSTGAEKEMLYTATVTASNGDFEISDLPVYKKLRLFVNAMNYGSANQDISFVSGNKAASGNTNQPQQGGSNGGWKNGIGGNINADKSLGSIALEPAASDLGNVTVTTSAAPLFKMDIDKKVFNVDKDIASSGQTAQEVMAHIPTVNVDIDGNVTMRNASPQLYVDGLPTTLTLEQIPSDLIDHVELITNPSAKYDASGGGGGIINIVLKKNKKSGYNGGIRAGGDTRWGTNLGGDLSYRQGKFNLTANVGFNRRKNKSTNELNRYNTGDNTTLFQSGTSQRNFRMLMGNLSLDYLMDNNNTFTIGGGIFDGRMSNNQPQELDSSLGRLGAADPYAYSLLNSTSKMHFTNYNGKFSYKHLFGGKDNHDITANVQYNSSNNSGFTGINTQYYNDPAFTDTRYPALLQNTNMDGYRRQWIAQADYENPLSDKSKLEAGIRGEFTNFYSDSRQFTDSTGIGESALLFRSKISSKYKYDDRVLAAYATFSSKIGDNLTYQIGARIESSHYTGNNTLLSGDGLPASAAHGDSTNTPFKVNFPLNLFPSLFVTYELPNRQDVQFNYTRKVNRPNFFQLLPIYDYSDPYNISTGNPGLKPEFTSNYELSYNKSYSHSGNFLATAYMRYTSNLITSYQYKEAGLSESSDSILVNTYMNANHSYTYGLELTNSIAVTKKWNVMANVNLFNTKIDAIGTDVNTTNQRVSWNAKLNNDIKLPWSLTFQLNGNYQGKTVLPNSGGSSRSGQGGRGGGGFNFNSTGSTQGYIDDRFSLDAALKKDWKGKNGNSFSLTVSMNDILKTNYYKTYSETAYMQQYQKRLNNPQVLRVMFSWRFGKLDANLFKRKNTKEVGDGGDMIGGEN